MYKTVFFSSVLHANERKKKNCEPSDTGWMKKKKQLHHQTRARPAYIVQNTHTHTYVYNYIILICVETQTSEYLTRFLSCNTLIHPSYRHGHAYSIFHSSAGMLVVRL